MNRRLWQPHVAFIMIVVFRPGVVVLVKNRSADWIRNVHDDERDELPRHCDLCCGRERATRLVLPFDEFRQVTGLNMVF
jgi:hypothetical protein